ncbi:MAG: alanine--tRNA ligase [Gammaproteobacteria bacterium]|nr:MAG: alanine--tRNA ligase [Gammaproteobacteria bacterium]
MRSQQIRQTFLDFFRDKGHEIVSSSPLVPANDKTLLFTNAGMVQFKEVFLGLEKRPYSRAVTSQKCVRAGGKHNDLENVGYTARHHTFFEMLGNFSFGDYFKEDAIRYAWELITEKFGLPADKLWVTVFEDDDEAYEIWAKQIGVPQDRISRIGAKDNFWQMGDTGPCGPCTEIFYDHGEHIWGGPPGTPEEDGDRFIEIWNLVFMQYDRQPDGELIPLPKPSVDTGMGLERIAAILQGVHSNYEIDVFVALIEAAGKLTHTEDLANNSLKVLADHIRSVVFLLADGVIPSNEGRGYVLRRIIRRAVRHGYNLGQKQPFFYRLVDTLVAEMGAAYPEIKDNQLRLEEQIRREEERFHRTIEDGMNVLEADLANLQGDTIAGDTLFKLYDTYGFPVDLTADIARERGLNVDLDGYEAAMQRQVEKSQAGGAFKGGTLLKTQATTEFLGYDHVEAKATISEIFIGAEKVNELDQGDAVIILDRTPFYAESGGQIGDIGSIKTDHATFVVTDTQKQGNAFLHIGYLQSGVLDTGQAVIASIDSERRRSIKRNHSATHLLHAALRRVLGKHVEQKGSLVTDERLRFDFSSDAAVSREQLDEIEHLANADILANYPVQAELMSQKQAKAKGAMALFGEKYGDVVRVLTMGPHSIELCGGTHVSRTGDIGQVIISAESGVAAGIRRLEAVTGWGAIAYRKDKQQQLDDVLVRLKATPANVENKITQLLAAQKDLQKQIKTLKQRALSGDDKRFGSVRAVAGFKVLTAEVKDFSANDLRDLADQQRDKQKADLVVLATVADGKVKLVASVAKSATDKLHAGKIIRQVAQVVGGKGGGRPDFAQAGGTQTDKINEALASVDRLLL